MKTLLTFLLFLVAFEFVEAQTNERLKNVNKKEISFVESGNKWTSVKKFAAGKLDSSNWILYDPSNSGLPGTHVYALAIDESGNKWFGVYNEGLVKFDGTNWTVYNTANSGISDNDIYSIAIDENGYIWAATYGGGLAMFNGTEWFSYGDANTGIFQLDYLYKIIIDESGNKWIGGYPGLVKYDGIDFTELTEDSVYYFTGYDIALDSIGNIWVATTAGGVAKYNGENWTYYNTTNSGIPHNMTYAILVDDSGYVWVATHSGLAKFNGTDWTIYGQDNSGLPVSSVTSIIIDNYGNKWFGTWGGGLVKFDGENWTVYNASNSGLPSENIRKIRTDEYGNKWLATDVGVIVFNENGLNAVDDESDNSAVSEFTLFQNYPNPFNPTTTITYVIARSEATRQSTEFSANTNNSTVRLGRSHAPLRSARNDGAVQVSLKIYDALGREVATLVNAKQSPGKYSVQFDAAELPSGVYFYTLRAGNFVQTRKMILMK